MEEASRMTTLRYSVKVAKLEGYNIACINGNNIPYTDDCRVKESVRRFRIEDEKIVYQGPVNFEVVRYRYEAYNNPKQRAGSIEEAFNVNKNAMQEFEIDWKGLGISPPIPEKQIKPLDKAMRIVTRRKTPRTRF